MNAQEERDRWLKQRREIPQKEGLVCAKVEQAVESSKASHMPKWKY